MGRYILFTNLQVRAVVRREFCESLIKKKVGMEEGADMGIREVEVEEMANYSTENSSSDAGLLPENFFHGESLMSH